jgi:hypothetical protein
MGLLRRWTLVPLSLVSVGVLAGCHSAGPTAPAALPDALSSPTGALQSHNETLDPGTTLTFVSAETGAPAVAVDVVVNGIVHHTDAAGEIRLSENVTLPASIEAASSDYLLRETVVRSRDTLRLSLWPRRSPTGLDEALTRGLIYTDAAGGASGALPLRRLNPAGGRVSLVPSVSLMQDEQAVQAHEAAAEALTRATQGHITFVVESNATSAVAVSTVVDANDPSMRTHAALAYRYLDGTQITGARIVFVSRDVARMAAVVTHELGHTFGLEHSSEPNDLMFPVVSGPKVLSLRETLAIDLMLQRRPGNRFPDNDREGLATLGRRTEVVACAETR